MKFVTKIIFSRRPNSTGVFRTAILALDERGIKIKKYKKIDSRKAVRTTQSSRRQYFLEYGNMCRQRRGRSWCCQSNARIACVLWTPGHTYEHTNSGESHPFPAHQPVLSSSPGGTKLYARIVKAPYSMAEATAKIYPHTPKPVHFRRT